MPESSIFVTIQFFHITNFYKPSTADSGSGDDVFSLEYELKVMPDISTGTRTMNPGAGSASFYPDSNYPNAIVVVSDFNFKEFFRTEVIAYCNTIAAIEVAFFGVPVANSGFYEEDCLILRKSEPFFSSLLIPGN